MLANLPILAINIEYQFGAIKGARIGRRRRIDARTASVAASKAATFTSSRPRRTASSTST